MQGLDSIRYKRFRKDGHTARDALAMVRLFHSDADIIDWRHDVGTWTQEGFDLRVTCGPDDFTDIDFYGKFTNTWDPDAIVWNTDPFGSEYRYFVPTCTEDERFPWFQKKGMAKHDARLAARKAVRDDAERASDLCTYVITVTASRHGVELGSASLGAIEFSDDFPGEAEIERYVFDEGILDDAIDNARTTLAQLCADNS